MYHGERFNSSTHLIGTALAITGSAWLITRAAVDGDPWKIVSFTGETPYPPFQTSKPTGARRRVRSSAVFAP